MPFSEEHTWRVGQRIRATVDRRLPDGRYFLRGKGIEWVAESSVPLREGEIVEGRVIRLDPLPTLRLSSSGEDNPATGDRAEKSPVRTHLSVNGEEFEVLYVCWTANGRSRGKPAVQKLAMVVRHEEMGAVGVEISLIGRYVNVEFKCPGLELAELMQEGSLVLERELNSNKLILGTFAASLWSDAEQIDELLRRCPSYDRIDWVT